MVFSVLKCSCFKKMFLVVLSFFESLQLTITISFVSFNLFPQLINHVFCFEFQIGLGSFQAYRLYENLELSRFQILCCPFTPFRVVQLLSLVLSG